MPFFMNRVKYKIIFSKKLQMVCLSHLDLMRLFSRALRRTKLPLFFTLGFNPHPKISFERALKLGKESDYEVAYVFLKESVDADIFKSRFQEELPDGITVKQVSEEP